MFFNAGADEGRRRAAREASAEVDGIVETIRRLIDEDLLTGRQRTRILKALGHVWTVTEDHDGLVKPRVESTWASEDEAWKRAADLYVKLLKGEVHEWLRLADVDPDATVGHDPTLIGSDDEGDPVSKQMVFDAHEAGNWMEAAELGRRYIHYSERQKNWVDYEVQGPDD